MRAGLVTSGLAERAGLAGGNFFSAAPVPSTAQPPSSLQAPPIKLSTLISTKFSPPAISRAQLSSSIAPVTMSVNDSPNNSGKQALFLLNAAELIDSVETFVFDCDGVIWNRNKLLDGVKEVIGLLRSKGKRLYFLTNNSTKSRWDCLKKAESLGLEVTEDEMFTSGFAAVLYLKSIKFPANKKVYLISESGLREEFAKAGISYIDGSDDDHKKVDFKTVNFVDHDPDVGAVVVGFDRNISYFKMQYAALCLRENIDCKFIATNCDEVIMPTGDSPGQLWPGESAMVGAIRGVTKKEPIVTGKPDTFMMRYLCDRFNINTDEICMVGDNLETDILFGKNGGCRTLLVLTGVTDLKTLQSPENNIQPDYYTYHISDLLVGLNDTTRESV
ncbi:hypothetical protein R1flu_019245 [Riccia fluitans]|uniref:phosphoglycolate phosphatase n=1 Tax=Riccia fluitans TaxID=41844 RepID=A0ABD1ZIF7_9MARC